jgi:LysR family nitrogen assimilation transcriptional regulator
MDIRAMRYFVAIVDHGSLTRAAEVVCVAQPALSQQLAAGRRIRRAIGAPQREGVRPTEAGKTLYRHVRNILRQVEIAGADVRVAGAEVSGTVAIGLPTTAAAAFGMALIRTVRQRYPQVRLQLFESMSGYISELLNQNRLDFAILFRDTPSRGGARAAGQRTALPDRHATRDRAAPGQTRQRTADTVPLKALDGIPLVLPSGSQGLREVVERTFAKAGMNLNVVADLDSLPFLLASAGRIGLHDTARVVAWRWRCGRASAADRSGTPAHAVLCWPRALPRSNAAEAVADVLREIVGERIALGGSLAPAADGSGDPVSVYGWPARRARSDKKTLCP